MPDERPFTLQQVDQARGDQYGISDDLDFIKSPARAIADAQGSGAQWFACHAHHSGARSRRHRSAVPMSDDRDWWRLDNGAHYRELAAWLRVAGKCRLPNPQRKLLTLAKRMSAEPINSIAVRDRMSLASFKGCVSKRAFLAYGISRSIAHRSTLSAGHGL
jgi:hypothetical protein